MTMGIVVFANRIKQENSNMRIDRINLQDHPPIKEFKIEISSNVVIVAGANGSGKTRLKEALVNTFRSPNETKKKKHGEPRQST